MSLEDALASFNARKSIKKIKRVRFCSPSMFHMQLNKKGTFRAMSNAKKAFVPVHTYPFSTAASAFKIEEPAAPMIAANI
jgi:hypothetical protein